MAQKFLLLITAGLLFSLFPTQSQAGPDEENEIPFVRAKSDGFLLEKKERRGGAAEGGHEGGAAAAVFYDAEDLEGADSPTLRPNPDLEPFDVSNRSSPEKVRTGLWRQLSKKRKELFLCGDYDPNFMKEVLFDHILKASLRSVGILSLEGFRVKEEDIQNFCSTFWGDQVKGFSLTRSKIPDEISDEALISLLDANAKLRGLFLRNVEITDDLMAAISRLPHLVELELSECSGLNTDERIEELGGFINSRLKRVFLQNLGLSKRRVEILISKTAANPAIIELDLGGNVQGEEERNRLYRTWDSLRNPAGVTDVGSPRPLKL